MIKFEIFASYDAKRFTSREAEDFWFSRFDAVTIVHAAGSWKGKPEPAIQVILFDADDLFNVCRTYCRQFGEECVLLNGPDGGQLIYGETLYEAMEQIATEEPANTPHVGNVREGSADLTVFPVLTPFVGDSREIWVPHVVEYDLERYDGLIVNGHKTRYRRFRCRKSLTGARVRELATIARSEGWASFGAWLEFTAGDSPEAADLGWK